MAMTTATTRSAHAAINVTPLIDVLLVLLIIFMVIEPSAVHGLSAMAPQPSPRHREAPYPQSIVVTIEGNASAPAYALDGVPLQQSDLPEHLRQLVQQQGRTTLLVHASPGLDYADVTTVLNAGRAAGADNMALLTGADTARN
ncbi:ExbD/TolR family protein [Terriglobus aquaticus]|uniref:ExbD/TolR family protein n=1 Tax=Terriglobus aquaticus TaxID=940139 RepID=A0ABW9KSQ1_9BACT|nr:biopolymer transporter ExbD [Terriglobus aquaticus]